MRKGPVERIALTGCAGDANKMAPARFSGDIGADRAPALQPRTRLAAAMAQLLLGRAFDIADCPRNERCLVIDLTRWQLTASRATATLYAVGIVIQPIDTVSKAGARRSKLGLAIDTAPLEARRFDPAAARQLAAIIADVLQAVDDTAIAVRARRQIRALCKRFPRPGFHPEVGHGG